MISNIPPTTAKADAVMQLAATAGKTVNGHSGLEAEIFLEQLLSDQQGPTNTSIRRRTPDDVGDGELRLVQDSECRALEGPRYLNGRPPYFPPVEDRGIWNVPNPQLSTLRLHNGYLVVVGEAPVIFGSDRAIIRKYSSGYNGLVHFYNQDIPQLLMNASYYDAVALVIFDDVWGLNYCHWLIDWLPRLAMTDIDSSELHVIVTNIVSGWQLETLLACGIREENIIQIDRWDAIQVRELIIPPYISEIFHPGFRGAPWVMQFLRQNLGCIASDDATPGKRLYISRGDAPGRRLLNEDDLIRQLKPLGFEAVTLTGLRVEAQVNLFSSASMVIAPHGAGLTNIAFCSRQTKILEIFTHTYGTCAFWVLAASMGLKYATFLTENSDDPVNLAHHDTSLDLECFMDLAVPFLGLNP